MNALHSTSAAPRGRLPWLCTSCGREWERLRGARDWLADVPRWFREGGLFESVCALPITVVFLALVLATEVNRCPVCNARCARRGPG